MTEPTATPPAPLSLVSRFIGMITAPRATFENVVANPRPVGILLVVALIMSVAAIAPQFTPSGRQAVLDAQVKAMEGFGMEVTPEIYEKMEASSRSTFSKVSGMMGTFIGLPIICLIFAALYWAFFNVALGGTASFKPVLAIVTHSQVIGAIGALAALPIQLMTGKFTATGPFNLGALAPMLEEGSLLANVLGFITVFGIWGFIVNAIGLAVLYRRNSRNISIALLALYVIFAVVVGLVASAFTARAS